LEKEDLEISTSFSNICLKYLYLYLLCQFCYKPPFPDTWRKFPGHGIGQRVLIPLFKISEWTNSALKHPSSVLFGSQLGLSV
jgi:hypothetical protein